MNDSSISAEQASLDVIIPVFNGSEYLYETYSKLSSVLAGCGTDYKIIFIDDGSSDGSVSVMKEIASENIQAGWIRLERNFGQQPATICGMRLGRGVPVLTIDDDLQHPPELIPDMLKLLGLGYDAVFAVKGINEKRTFGSRMRDLFFSYITRTGSVKVSSYRLLGKNAVNKLLDLEGDGFYISAEVLRDNELKASNVYYSGTELRGRRGRYSVLRRFILFAGLISKYTFRNYRTDTGCNTSGSVQCTIAEKGGCLC